MTSADVEFTATRTERVVESARLFRVRLHIILELSRATWSNAEEQVESMVNVRRVVCSKLNDYELHQIQRDSAWLRMATPLARKLSRSQCRKDPALCDARDQAPVQPALWLLAANLCAKVRPEEKNLMQTRHWQRGAGSGLQFTELGFGTAPLGNLYRAISDQDAQAILNAAWDTGCRYFDTAPLYGLGLAETRLNHFLRKHNRDEYVLSTKAGRLLAVCPPDQRTGIGKFFDTPTRREIYDYSYDGVMRSFEASLERLGVDRIDILFAHDLDIFTHGSKEASDTYIEEFLRSGYYAMLALRDQGVIKAFGGGINEWQVCQTLAERGDFDLFLLAGRYTLLEQEALESFLPLCQRRGIGIVLGGPYNSGILATGPKPGAYYNYEAAPPEIIDRVTRIEQVCRRHGVALIEAALKFPLMHTSVVSLIPGGQRVEEVTGNRKILDTDIPAALWHDLKSDGLMREDAPTG